jgi:choline dehydrogenase-like flavoprotein
MMDFDAIIVGAGLLGLVTAQELATLRPGLKIGVIEAGPWPGSQADVSALRARVKELPYAVRWSTTNQLFADRGLKEVVGGRSLCWGGVSLRMQDSVLADPNWPPTLKQGGLTSCYERAEELMHVRPVSNQKLPLNALRLLTGRSLNPLKRALLADDVPFSPVVYLPTLKYQIMPGIRASAVTRSSVGYLKLDCMSSSGRTEFVARHVILACGSIINAAMLAGSMLRESGESETTVPIADHIIIGAWTALREGEFSELEGLDAWSFTEGPYYEIAQCYRHQNYRVLDWWTIGDCPPSNTKTVTISAEKDQFRAEVSFGYANNDYATVQNMADAVSQAISAIPACDRTGVMPPAKPIGLPRLGESAAFDRWIWYLNPPGNVHHEYATTPFGSGLIDDHGGSKQFEGLYVVGCSTFPRMGAFNPSLTASALALRTVDYIVARYY